jgi:NADPH2:quinone reductase
VAQLSAWYAQGKVKPHVSATFPLARAAEGIALMAARQVVGKVVIQGAESIA